MKKNGLPPLSDTPAVDYIFKSHFSWGTKNTDRFNALMEEATKLVEPGFYLGDNLFTWMRNLSALKDAAFRQAWESNITCESDQAILWRRYILCCAAYHCIQLEGDFVECGVLFGTGIKTIIDYFGKNNFDKSFWGYDTFDTNPTTNAPEFEGQQDGLFDYVKTRFSEYSQVKLIKGLLPESLANQSPDKIGLLHIDLNDAKYEIATLDVLFDKVVPSGIIILDDYEWSSGYKEQKQLEDPWFDARGYRVIPLPTGQGLIIKR